MVIEQYVKNVLFGELDTGDVFRWRGSYFLKIPSCNSRGDEFNVYDLMKDDYNNFYDEMEVTPVKAKLVIE